MQYLFIFLAVLAVILVMIGFLFLVLKQMAGRISQQVRDRYMEELSVFDDLYEEKAERLMRMREEEQRQGKVLLEGKNIDRKEDHPEQTGAPRAGLSFVELPPSRTARRDFSSEYRYIRKRFAVDRKEMIRAVKDMEPQDQWKKGTVASGLLEKLSLDTAYHLSSLESEEQMQLLSEFLTKEEMELAEEYLWENGVFDACGFYEAVRMIQSLYEDKTTVYTGDETYEAGIPGVEVVYDEAICEGIRIVRGNHLFDYSI
ncbi:MAG: hypothetical protein ACLTKI_00240 [Lachnospiraceae bacterium]